MSSKLIEKIKSARQSDYDEKYGDSAPLSRAIDQIQPQQIQLPTAQQQAAMYPQLQQPSNGMPPLVGAVGYVAPQQSQMQQPQAPQPWTPQGVGPGDPWAAGAPQAQPQQPLADPWAPRKPSTHSAWWYEPGF